MSNRIQLLRILVTASCALASASASHAQTLSRASVGPNGVEGDDYSAGAVLSADGRWLAFTSWADNLVPGDLHDTSADLILRDLTTGVNELVVFDLLGQQAQGESGSPSLSPDGRYVLFTSNVATLVAGDANGCNDVFLRDRLLGTNERVNLTWLGGEADQDCGAPSPSGMSDDARRIVFESPAKNLVAGKTTWWWDVFVRDRALGTTVCASVPWNGGEADSVSGFAAISGDGRFVVFSSSATNLVPGDTNDKHDLFLRDLDLGTIERVNLTHDGLQANESAFSSRLSFDGRRVWFDSDATNLVPNDTNVATDVFERDRLLGTTTRISVTQLGGEANWYSYLPAPSPDGRFVAFSSGATNLAPNDTNGHEDIFVRDALTGAVGRMSLGRNGAQGNEFCDYSAISADGRFIAFESTASNLVPDDHNRTRDIFVVDRGPALVASYCTAKPNSQGCLATTGARGTPSCSVAAPFTISGRSVVSSTSGALFYGLAPGTQPFQGARTCIAPPLSHLPPVLSGGDPQSDCSGSLHVDFNAYVQSGADPALQPGVEVFGQWWFVDPGAASGTGFSDALQFVLQP